jgi:L,D-peptidoglycan transpeptidase YkuD (ErfK/YbiS/YcfS/YnhG family)
MNHFSLTLKRALILSIYLIINAVSSAQVPADTQQLILGLALTKKSSHVTLSMFEKTKAGWKQDGADWKARLGKNGLAWGIGLHPRNIEGAKKKEGDGRAPSGIFRIGSESGFAFGYAPVIKKIPSLPYKVITSRDLWVEDSSSPYYNRHILLPHQPKSKWEKNAQMRQGDHAHSLKLFIGHNEGTAKQRATPNAGSSIFFHIWRGGGSKATADCSTMHEAQLKEMISKIDPSKNPVYILLTANDYKKYRASWKLP